MLAIFDVKIFFTIVTGALCIFYLFTILYKLLTVLISVIAGGQIKISEEELDALDPKALPIYTVLVPLYKEANIAGKIVGSLSSIDYPSELLDVILLLEKDDTETLRAVESTELPPYIRTHVVPEGKPKTKPRACLHGLGIAKGEFLVIFDAEDKPEPDQLLKAVAAFNKCPSNVGCLQAKLNYYNPRYNWLTKFFTIEYTTWFDLFLPGLTRLKMPIPLGGTSNHFRTSILRELGGWDPFNVTEDCDLGVRLHSKGFRTRVLDSTTWEEANSEVKNWILQRSRWVKGYIQTHLVHTRRELNWLHTILVTLFGGWFIYGLTRTALHLTRYVQTRADVHKALASEVARTNLTVTAIAGLTLWLIGYIQRSFKLGPLGQTSFLLTVGGLSATLLLNPIFWVIGIFWLFIRWKIYYETSYYDDAMLTINYWSVASHWFWGVSITLLISNLLLIIVHVIACFRRNLKDLIGYALLVPFYWVLISVAAWHGFLQLFTRAHYWEKTIHGLEGAGGDISDNLIVSGPTRFDDSKTNTDIQTPEQEEASESEITTPEKTVPAGNESTETASTENVLAPTELKEDAATEVTLDAPEPVEPTKATEVEKSTKTEAATIKPIKPTQSEPEPVNLANCKVAEDVPAQQAAQEDETVSPHDVTVVVESPVVEEMSNDDKPSDSPPDDTIDLKGISE